VVAIRVGRSRRSNAVYYLPDQGSVDRLLRALAALRPAGGALERGGERGPGRRPRRRGSRSPSPNHG
jgi:hypothetical protein